VELETIFPNTSVDGRVRFGIRGAGIQTVEFLLPKGTQLVAQPDAFLYAAGGVRRIGINWGSRLRDPIVRRWSGEAPILSSIVCEGDLARVGIAGPHHVGEVVHIPLTQGRSIVCQRGSFIAALGDVHLSIAFTRRIRAGFFGGQGVVFQRITGEGDVFLHALGRLDQFDVLPERRILVSTKNILCFDGTVGFDVQLSGGLLSLAIGGQGVFLSQLQGPGRVRIQSMDVTGETPGMGRYAVPAADADPKGRG
jgi:uncharacterized protein (AIM24 family)